MDGGDYGDDNHPPSPIKITAMNDGDDPDPPMPPESRGGEDNGDDDEGDLSDYDDDHDGEIDRLPEFANEDSKALFAKIKKHKEALAQTEKEVEDTKQRLGVMVEHLKNAKQEVGHTTDLVNSKKKEIETEDHLTQLVVREAGRYQQEFRRLQESCDTADNKMNMAHNALHKGSAKMDQFKLDMHWNQQELEQWALAAKQKEDDNMALQKYHRGDESKIKELELAQERLTTEVVSAKVALENESTETTARQIELDRTAEDFRNVHKERQNLVHKWQETIEAMRSRDGTVQDLALAYAEERKKLKAQLEVLAQQQEQLDSLSNGNADLEAKTEALDRVVQQRREEMMDSQTKLQDFTDEVDVLKSELAASANALMRKRSENAAATRELEAKKEALAEARRAYQDTKKALDDESAAANRTEMSAKEAEANLEAAELALKKKGIELAAMKDNTFRQSQALFQLRQKEASMISEISAAENSSRAMQAKIRSLDAESIRQQELIYNAEFQIQQMERKVSRGLGERSDEETKLLKKEIAGLESEVDAGKEQRKMLQAQCRKLNFELRGAQRAKDVAAKTAQELKEKISELEKENISYAASLDGLVKQKEEHMVQNDVLRLEVKRLRDMLNAKADKVFSLENRKQQLALSMEERKHEIGVHQEVQRAQLRAAEEERHRVTVELGGRRMAVEKLRDKYETLCKVSGVRGEESGGGEPKSQAFYLIQAAQKREELQRKGDELDQDIRKSEKEIRALTHTLGHLTGQNTDFRSAHQKVEASGEDFEKLRLLEEQNKVASDALFKKKKELQRLQTDLEEDGRRLEQVASQATRLEERNMHLTNAKQQMDSELEVQRDAVEKISKRVQRMSTAHRDRLGGAGETLQEKDFRCEATMETVQNALYTLGQLAAEYPEIRDVLSATLNETGLQVPAQPTVVLGENPQLSARSFEAGA